MRWEGLPTVTGSTPTLPSTPAVTPYRLAEVANLIIGIGTFVGVAIGSFVAGIVHISTLCRIGVYVGLLGTAVLIGWGAYRASVRPRRRYLRSLALGFASEISDQSRMLKQAVKDGCYWPSNRSLPADTWIRRGELAGEPRFTDAFFAVIAAYHEVDRLNWLAMQRGQTFVINETIDGIAGALKTFDDAYNALLLAANGLRV